MTNLGAPRFDMGADPVSPSASSRATRSSQLAGALGSRTTGSPEKSRSRALAAARRLLDRGGRTGARSEEEEDGADAGDVADDVADEEDELLDDDDDDDDDVVVVVGIR